MSKSRKENNRDKAYDRSHNNKRLKMQDPYYWFPEEDKKIINRLHFVGGGCYFMTEEGYAVVDYSDECSFIIWIINVRLYINYLRRKL